MHGLEVSKAGGLCPLEPRLRLALGIHFKTQEEWPHRDRYRSLAAILLGSKGSKGAPLAGVQGAEPPGLAYLPDHASEPSV